MKFGTVCCKKLMFVFHKPLKLKASGSHITWFSEHRNAASQRGGGEGSRLQSQRDQDLCVVEDAEHLIFKTSTEERTVDLTNKDTTKDSQRFSRWFHSASLNGIF